MTLLEKELGQKYSFVPINDIEEYKKTALLLNKESIFKDYVESKYISFKKNGTYIDNFFINSTDKIIERFYFVTEDLTLYLTYLVYNVNSNNKFEIYLIEDLTSSQVVMFEEAFKKNNIIENKEDEGSDNSMNNLEWEQFKTEMKKELSDYKTSNNTEIENLKSTDTSLGERVTTVENSLNDKANATDLDTKANTTDLDSIREQLNSKANTTDIPTIDTSNFITQEQLNTAVSGLGNSSNSNENKDLSLIGEYSITNGGSWYDYSERIGVNYFSRGYKNFKEQYKNKTLYFKLSIRKEINGGSSYAHNYTKIITVPVKLLPNENEFYYISDLKNKMLGFAYGDINPSKTSDKGFGIKYLNKNSNNYEHYDYLEAKIYLEIYIN